MRLRMSRFLWFLCHKCEHSYASVCAYAYVTSMNQPVRVFMYRSNRPIPLPDRAAPEHLIGFHNRRGGNLRKAAEYWPGWRI